MRARKASRTPAPRPLWPPEDGGFLLQGSFGCLFFFLTMLEDQIASLNPQQKEVALCERHCLAVAAPGSGKTKTLAVKAARLLMLGQTVTAVTFTRDAAMELRERILALAGEDKIARLLVGTFHSIDMLMAFPGKGRSPMGKEILSAGYSRLDRKWEIIKESMRRSIVDRSIKQAELDLEIDQATAEIEAFKAGYRAPSTDQERALVETYTGLLRRHGVIDFQDILLETNKEIRAGRISPLQTAHLMIDEFQDTDKLQYDWALLHAESGSILTAVGDDDQSIYGFRRALGYKGMTDFVGTLRAERIVLGTNYRSHEEVLAPARQLIDLNRERMPKDLVSFKGPGGTSYWDRFGDRIAEAEQCVQWAAKALSEGRSVGVLARTNKRLDEVEAVCIEHDVPCLRSEGGSILNSLEMGVFMAMLRLILADEARDADQVLSWCGCSEEELTSLHKFIGQRGLATLTKKQLDQVTLSAGSKKVIAMLARRREEWRTLLAANSLQYVLDGVLGVLITPVSENKMAVKMLHVVKQAFAKPLREESGMTALKERVSALEAKRVPSKADPGDDKRSKVALMTAHGSKGLEWDHVWIVGAEEGSFPDDGSGLQEERRLFFVAMTRARQHLMVSASGAKPSSSFIAESAIPRLPMH